MRVKVVVFDLDDTLYPEIEFVKSGFLAVARAFGEPLLFEKMCALLETHGRGKVFDLALESFGLSSKSAIKQALSIYRQHTPKITLPRESQEILEYYQKRHIPLYIVTDGNKLVQANKIKALGLDRYVKKSFITHRYGTIHAKPSPHCFLKIAHNEGVEYGDVVYIGDNCNKDFVGIKKLGFRTIRIKQGMFADVQKPQEYQAEYEIQNLLELKKRLKVRQNEDRRF